MLDSILLLLLLCTITDSCACFRVASGANGAVIQEVLEAVRIDQGGDKCPWTSAQIRGM